MIVRILRMLCGVECKRWFGLRSLKTVEGDLIVQQNTVLKSLSGLLGVTSVGGKLTIESNSALPTCEAEGLRDAIGAANIQGEITISGNGGSGDCAP